MLDKKGYHTVFCQTTKVNDIYLYINTKQRSLSIGKNLDEFLPTKKLSPTSAFFVIFGKNW
jgi:hypothetical protein